MQRKTLVGSLALIALGTLLGLGMALFAEQAHHFSSTDAFCGTTCHSMDAYVSTHETYLTSAHRTAWSGVHAGCADCHIPEGLVASTWAHVKGGVKDIYMETTNDFQDPRVWEERRARLAEGVRNWLLETDSGTCRSCHQEDAIEPALARGKREHKKAKREGITCIACHYNLVHRPVPPGPGMLERAKR